VATFHNSLHVRQKDFFQRDTRDFSKIFVGGTKVAKFVCYHSKVRKQPLLKFSKSRGTKLPSPTLPTPIIHCSNFLKPARYSNFSKFSDNPVNIAYFSGLCMLSVPREKISKDKQGFIERGIDRFG